MQWEQSCSTETDKQNKTKLIDAFRNFANAPNYNVTSFQKDIKLEPI
jgi:hypothetical protein